MNLLYDFKDTETGEAVQVRLDHKAAPHKGDVIEIDGRRLKRLNTNGVSERSIARPADGIRGAQFRQGCIVSRQLPRWWKGAKQHTKDGWPAFETEREVQEACRREADKPGDAHPVWDR